MGPDPPPFSSEGIPASLVGKRTLKFTLSLTWLSELDDYDTLGGFFLEQQIPSARYFRKYLDAFRVVHIRETSEMKAFLLGIE